jgi:fatty-acid peroxygenase
MPDLAVELFRRGYTALPRLWSSVPPTSDYVGSRLLGHRAHVVRGADGARLLHDESVVERAGALPGPLADVLFGRGAVHGLDDEPHRRRKALFLDVLTRDRVELLGDDVARELADRTPSWPQRTPFSLFDELVSVYGACGLRWAGVDAEPGEAARVAARLAWIVDGFGFSPAAYARARGARWWADRWARDLVLETRAGHRRPGEGTALRVLASGGGRELSPETAAVELLNVLRPIVAVAWLGVFGSLAMVRHPYLAQELRGPDGADARARFADEVRRTTPFVPALAGRVRRSTQWKDHWLEHGDMVVLDVPGTNHHRSWGDPERFRPSRFNERRTDAFELVPQGGGDVRHGHRCPGEPVTMTLLDRTLRCLAGVAITISTAEPDLRRMPTLPRGGLRVMAVDLPDGVPA